LEANYAKGKNINNLKYRYDIGKDKLLQLEESDV